MKKFCTICGTLCICGAMALGYSGNAKAVEQANDFAQGVGAMVSSASTAMVVDFDNGLGHVILTREQWVDYPRQYAGLPATGRKYFYLP